MRSYAPTPSTGVIVCRVHLMERAYWCGAVAAFTASHQASQDVPRHDASHTTVWFCEGCHPSTPNHGEALELWPSYRPTRRAVAWPSPRQREDEDVHVLPDVPPATPLRAERRFRQNIFSSKSNRAAGWKPHDLGWENLLRLKRSATGILKFVQSGSGACANATPSNACHAEESSLTCTRLSALLTQRSESSPPLRPWKLRTEPPTSTVGSHLHQEVGPHFIVATVAQRQFQGVPDRASQESCSLTEDHSWVNLVQRDQRHPERDVPGKSRNELWFCWRVGCKLLGTLHGIDALSVRQIVIVIGVVHWWCDVVCGTRCLSDSSTNTAHELGQQTMPGGARSAVA